MCACIVLISNIIKRYAKESLPSSSAPHVPGLQPQNRVSGLSCLFILPKIFFEDTCIDPYKMFSPTPRLYLLIYLSLAYLLTVKYNLGIFLEQ